MHSRVIKGAVSDYVRKKKKRHLTMLVKSNSVRAAIRVYSWTMMIRLSPLKQGGRQVVPLFLLRGTPAGLLTLTLVQPIENSQLARASLSSQSTEYRAQINNHAETNRTALANTNRTLLCHVLDGGHENRSLKRNHL